jgi:hypothetical protein
MPDQGLGESTLFLPAMGFDIDGLVEFPFEHFHDIAEFWRVNAAAIFPLCLQEIVQPELRRRPNGCLQTFPHVAPFYFDLSKIVSAHTVCSRCGTFGNERPLPSFDKCSSRFREPGLLPPEDCTYKIYGVQWEK